MKALKIKKIDGCLDAELAKDILFDEILTYDFIKYLGCLGKLIYHDNMKKPFFSIIVRGRYTIKGSEGNRSVRILMPGDSQETLEDLIEYAGNYKL